ncbi:hypothetical protein EFM54_08535 [Lentilactobacillus buchneri]|uniref:hypothetical protein n=1 Tax=Lentilactobacillus buchneri TaxID=1581 RepID=UPI0021A621E4|nr:hypothetical protein [Lentilactobacillus buchneri]MCT2899023.1 hypothetical protein [Lentilactobacillus buchneri]
MRINKFMLSICSTALFGMSTLCLSTQASSWHTGTPSFLVGKTYRVRMAPKKTFNIATVYNTLKGTRHSIKFTSQQNGMGGTDTRYKESKSGKSYIIRAKPANFKEFPSYQYMKIVRKTKTKVIFYSGPAPWHKWGKTLKLMP